MHRNNKFCIYQKKMASIKSENIENIIKTKFMFASNYKSWPIKTSDKCCHF